MTVYSASSIEIFNFFDEVENFFEEKRSYHLIRFLRGFSSLILYCQHQLYKTDMLDAMGDWTKVPNSPLYNFTEAFGKFLPYNLFENDKLIALLRKLYEQLEYDKLNVINAAVGNIAFGLRRFSALHQERAKSLLTILLEDFDPLNENLAIHVLVGLIEANKEFLLTTENLMKEEIYQPAVISALSFENLLSETEVEYFLPIISFIENKSQKYLRQLPKFYSSVIRNKSINNTEIVKSCFDALRSLIINEDSEIPFQVLHEIRFINDYEEEKTTILLALLEQEHFDKRLIGTFGWIFLEYKDSSYYFKFLIAYAIKFKVGISENIFEHVIPYLREKNKVSFDSNLVNCLIHDLGEVRWIAIRLLSRLFSLYNLKKFEYNILSLNPKEQFKLFTSVLSFPSEPKYNLPVILPIIQTENDFVKEAFICRIELLTQDYGMQVIDVIKENWPNMSEDIKAFLERVKEYEIEFGLHLDKKAKIKELNPLYTQSSYFNTYAKNYGRQFKRKINKGVEENSIFSKIATNITLAKGGGWRHQQTGEIQQLSTIGTSMTLPRGYFISPDNSEWQMKVERMENWNKFLNEWESIL